MRSRLLAGFLAITLVLLGSFEVPLALAYSHRLVHDAALRVERDASDLPSPA